MNPNNHQCTSTLLQRIKAPLSLVWSLLRRFDRPHAYKTFNKTCTMLKGDGDVGSVREVGFISGLPGRVSLERLDHLDDDSHVMVYSTLGNDQRLDNYRSVTTVHEEDGGGGTTVVVVVESYVVDVPEGNSEEETRTFVDTLLGCNLRSLARVAEKLAHDEVSRTTTV